MNDPNDGKPTTTIDFSGEDSFQVESLEDGSTRVTIEHGAYDAAISVTATYGISNDGNVVLSITNDNSRVTIDRAPPELPEPGP